MRTSLHLLLLGMCLVLPSGVIVDAQRQAESRNVVLVGHNDLSRRSGPGTEADVQSQGDGGEGLALQQLPDGRRILYLAHEAPQRCVSIIDVTKTESPVLVNQLPSPTPGVTRCNSLGLSGNVLAVANQTAKPGGKRAGMWVLDVSDFAKVSTAKRLDDLSLAFFDTSGPESRGVHNLWFVDGEFAHLTTGMPDFRPTNPQDDQIYANDRFTGGLYILRYTGSVPMD